MIIDWLFCTAISASALRMLGHFLIWLAVSLVAFKNIHSREFSKKEGRKHKIKK
jgi:hypothetical protein